MVVVVSILRTRRPLCDEESNTISSSSSSSTTRSRICKS
jgi:hypothetical protein